jgi:hypothetical protein
MRRIERALERVVPANPGGVIYGVIVIGALLAAESDQHDSYLDTIASALIAAALYWLAHAYAGLLGRRLLERERLSARALGLALARDVAIVRGAALPLAVLVLALATGAAQHTAVIAALWSAIASLVVFELLAGVRSGASASELALDAGVGVTMGVAVLALKIFAH